MSRTRIYFSELLGNHCTETQMFMLDWMLKTGKPFRQRVGKWTEDGISKFIFDYSANDYDKEVNILESFYKMNMFFDVVFARAVFQEANKAIKEWRIAERISQDSYRMFDLNQQQVPEHISAEYGHFNLLIQTLIKFKGTFLKKEFAHPDFPDRTNPKILDVRLYTVGDGWIVEYEFSFKKYNYEPGWIKSYWNRDNLPLYIFLYKVIEEIKTQIIADK